MKFFDYILTSYKNLSRQKARTFLTVVAITVGSLSLILMISLLVGVRQGAMDSLKNLGAFNLITVTRDPNSIDDNPSLIRGDSGGSDDEGKKIDEVTLGSIKKLPYVADATLVASVWMKTMRLEGQDKKMWSNITAYQPEAKVFDMPLLAGRNLNNADMDNIVVGWRFIQMYGYADRPEELIGKRVTLAHEAGGSNPDWGPPPQKPPQNADKEWWEEQSKKSIDIPATIVGVADNKMMDDSQNFVTLAWAKRLMTRVRWEYDDSVRKECEEKLQRQRDKDFQNGQNYDGGNYNCDGLDAMRIFKEDEFSKRGYGGIILKTDDMERVKSVAPMIENMGYGVVTAQNMIDEINEIFTALTVVLGTIGGISLFVASIGIINTMIMATFERTREIGVMRACGATRATIRKLFTFEAAFLGFCGGALGLVISLILGQIARIIVEKYGADMGNIPLDHVGKFPLWLIFGVLAFTTFIGLISGLYPAIKAARLNPVDALRYE